MFMRAKGLSIEPMDVHEVPGVFRRDQVCQEGPRYAPRFCLGGAHVYLLVPGRARCVREGQVYPGRTRYV